MGKKLSVSTYFCVFLASVFLAVVWLIIGACLPQQRILPNIQESAPMMEEEGDYPQIADRMYASMLDNWTEVLILTESYETHIGDWLSIFTNPKVPNGTSYTDDMRQYDDGSAEIYEYYVRYWMGFRTIIRLLLCVFNYWQIRRYLVIAFFSLFSLVICSLAKHIDEKMHFYLH